MHVSETKLAILSGELREIQHIYTPLLRKCAYVIHVRCLRRRGHRVSQSCSSSELRSSQILCKRRIVEASMCDVISDSSRLPAWWRAAHTHQRPSQRPHTGLGTWLTCIRSSCMRNRSLNSCDRSCIRGEHTRARCETPSKQWHAIPFAGRDRRSAEAWTDRDCAKISPQDAWASGG